jgi:hypothetical protein
MSSLLLALGKKPGDDKPSVSMDADDDSEPGMDDAGYQAAASDVMDAVKAGDASALSDALQAFVSMCK